MKAALLGLACMGAAALGQETPVFRAQSNTVVVDAAVAAGQRTVPNLRREDFVLLDDGQARKIGGIAQDEVPLDIVLVCQVPLRGPNQIFPHPGFAGQSLDNFPRLIAAAAYSVAGARPADRVAMVTYGRDPHIALKFTNDRKAIAGALQRLRDPGNGDENIVISSEGVAIEYAVRMIADVEKDDPDARTNRRRLIVLVSNVFGVGVRYAPEPVIRRLWDQNIALSVIDDARPTAGTTTVQRSDGGESQTILFRRYNPIHIAQATGGDRMFAVDGQKAPDLLTPMRQRYTLWFNQPPDATAGESRTIKVDLSGEARRRFPDAVVKAREGYVAR